MSIKREVEEKESKYKFRARTFCLVLYIEDETHKRALEKVQKSYDYAMCCHDKDVDENGVIKKEHYHIVLQFKNAKWNTALAEELGITENYLEEARSIKRALLYLIHFYDEDKYQYSTKEVTGPLKKRLEDYINNEGKTESEKVLEILEEIDNTEEYIDFKVFVKHIAKIGYWDVYRRAASTINHYVDLHNKDY